jgi:serine/threonine-protein kinase
MAPEQAFGEAIDERVDLWAVGAMLYECVAGRRPLEGDNLGQLLKKLARLSIPFLDTVSPSAPVELVRLVHELLSERGARPRSAREVAARLASLDLAALDPAALDFQEEPPRVVVAPTPSASDALDSEGATFAMAGEPQSWVAVVRRSPWPLAVMIAIVAVVLVAAIAREGGSDQPAAAAVPTPEPAAVMPIATSAPTAERPEPAAPTPPTTAAASAGPTATPRVVPTPRPSKPKPVTPAPSASSDDSDGPGKLLTTPPF